MDDTPYLGTTRVAEADSAGRYFIECYDYNNFPSPTWQCWQRVWGIPELAGAFYTKNDAERVLLATLGVPVLWVVVAVWTPEQYFHGPFVGQWAANKFAERELPRGLAWYAKPLKPVK